MMGRVKGFELTPKEYELCVGVAGLRDARMLNPDYADALLAYANAGAQPQCYALVAESLGIRIGTLKSRLHRGRKILLELRKEKSNACV